MTQHRKLSIENALIIIRDNTWKNTIGEVKIQETNGKREIQQGKNNIIGKYANTISSKCCVLFMVMKCLLKYFSTKQKFAIISILRFSSLGFGS